MRRLAIPLAALVLATATIARAQALPADAQRHVERGGTLFERGSYDGALAEYERAYELLSSHPQRYLLLFDIGQCHERLFRYDRALEYYRRYLEVGGPQAEDRAAVQARIEALGSLLGTLRIRTSVPRAEVWIDSHRVGTAPGDVRVPGGPHVVELRARGYEPSRREIQIAARQTIAFRVRLERRYEGIDPVWFWITASASAATLVTGAVLGGMTLSARGDVDDKLASERRFEVTMEDDGERIADLALATDIVLGIGGGLAVGAFVIALFTRWGGGGAAGERRDSSARLRLAPSAGPRAAGFVLGGEL